jgi:hypothetical protein
VVDAPNVRDWSDGDDVVGLGDAHPAMMSASKNERCMLRTTRVAHPRDSYFSCTDDSCASQPAPVRSAE